MEELLVNELMFEYDQLRKEIMHNDTLSLQILGATIIFSTAIIGFISSPTIQKEWLKGTLCFIPFCISFISLWASIDRARSTYAIASYLRVFTERELKAARWETRLARLRDIAPKLGRSKFVNYQFSIYILFIAINYLVGSYLIWIDRQNKTLGCAIILGFIVGLFFIIWSLIIAFRRRKDIILNNEITFDREWKKIKDKGV